MLAKHTKLLLCRLECTVFIGVSGSKSQITKSFFLNSSNFLTFTVYTSQPYRRFWGKIQGTLNMYFTVWLQFLFTGWVKLHKPRGGTCHPCHPMKYAYDCVFVLSLFTRIKSLVNMVTFLPYKEDTQDTLIYWYSVLILMIYN